MTKKKFKINENARFKMAINTYLSLITLKVNGLNIPIEKLKVAAWIKIRPVYMLLTRGPLQT